MSKIKFDHAVIYDGVFYPANTPIEVKEAPKKGKSDTEAPKKKAGAEDNDNSGTV